MQPEYKLERVWRIEEGYAAREAEYKIQWLLEVLCNERRGLS